MSRKFFKSFNEERWKQQYIIKKVYNNYKVKSSIYDVYFMRETEKAWMIVSFDFQNYRTKSDNLFTAVNYKQVDCNT